LASENPYRPIFETVLGSTDSTENKTDITGSGTPLSTGAKQPFGFVSLVALVVASMIGSGVFTTSGFALGDLKDSRLVMAVWCIGGVVALCGAIGYGTLAARLPGSGGEYLFLSRAVHPAIGFLAGWISLIAGFSVPMALAAKTFATYLLSGSQVSESIVIAVAIGAIVVAALANFISAHGGAWLQNALVITKLLLLTVFIGLAALTPAGGLVGDLTESLIKRDVGSGKSASCFSGRDLGRQAKSIFGFAAEIRAPRQGDRTAGASASVAPETGPALRLRMVWSHHESASKA